MRLSRRAVLAAAAASAAVAPWPASAAPGSFESFLASVRTEARAKGISVATLDRALTGLKPNQKVIDLDHHQPESTFTWDQYRTRIVSDARVQRGRQYYAANRAVMTQVTARYGVPAGIVMGIWGLETDYGRFTGGFNVIEALATLSWEGRRAAFFRSELLDALRILDHGDIAFAQMTGSYAGAMGQTQFMPDSFLKYAVDWNGTGRRDIWGDIGCVFASTANYLAREGWQANLPWGQRVTLAGRIDPYIVGHEHRRPVAEWAGLGVRSVTGQALRDAPAAALIMPGGESEPNESYLVYYPNYKAIRSYNPPDFYCLSVGLIGDLVTA